MLHGNMQANLLQNMETFISLPREIMIMQAYAYMHDHNAASIISIKSENIFSLHGSFLEHFIKTLKLAW